MGTVVGSKVREFPLDDGTIMTVKTMIKLTGWARNTCYRRLLKTTCPIELFKPKSHTHSNKTYTLDDGSTWTSQSLAIHLNCKRSVAGTRLSVMNGESKRILRPVSYSSLYDGNGESPANKEIRARIEKRMWYDKEGHWKLINKYT